MSYIMDLRKIDGIGHRPLQTVGVCVYIFDRDGKILLTKRKDDSTWCVPGGIVEIGEIPLEAAKREVLEETGLKVDNLSLFDVTGGEDGHHIFPNGDEIFSVDVHYVCKDYIGKLRKQDSEVLKLQFFDVNNLPPDLWQIDRKIINLIVNENR